MGERFKQTKLTAWLDHSGHPRLRSFVSFMTQYNVAISIVFAAAIVFSLGDFLSSTIATNMGLFESNFLLTSFASFFHTSLLVAFGVTKLGIIGATTLSGVVGVRAKDHRTKKLAFVVVAFFAVLYLFVTVNNIYWIQVSLSSGLP